MAVLSLKDGIYDIPNNKLVNVITCLEMVQRPTNQKMPFPSEYCLEPILASEIDQYRALYKSIGEDWLWFSRTLMSDEDLYAILSDKDIVVFALSKSGDNVGLLELDFRSPDNCELVFFGLHSSVMGKGLGKILINHAIDFAWSREISRFWLHTCTFDSPAALNFYLRAGFVPFKRQIELHDDFRLSGVLPRTVAPHIPVLND